MTGTVWSHLSLLVQVRPQSALYFKIEDIRQDLIQYVGTYGDRDPKTETCLLTVLHVDCLNLGPGAGAVRRLNNSDTRVCLVTKV